MMQSPPMPLSCVPCAKRKVRCDRAKPCSHCRRRRGDVCEYPIPIGASWNNNTGRVPLERMQSERIARLEQYIRSLGRDPDQAAQGTIANPTGSNERLIPSDVPSQNVKRQRDGSSCTVPAAGSRNSEQARLVEHDEQTTYIEAFVPV
jgi:hypothetical protein